ncbi:hypothetical protein D3C73_1636550 [compost metagenome]
MKELRRPILSRLLSKVDWIHSRFFSLMSSASLPSAPLSEKKTKTVLSYCPVRFSSATSRPTLSSRLAIMAA